MHVFAVRMYGYAYIGSHTGCDSIILTLSLINAIDLLPKTLFVYYYMFLKSLK